MPVASTLRELINALRTKKTRTMYALDELFGSRAALARLQNHPHRQDLDVAHAFEPNPGDPLPPWAVTELTGGEGAHGRVTHRLSDVEVEHVRQWPRADKDELRVALRDSLNNDEPLHFFWELHGGNREAIQISGGEVTFRSPQQNAEVSGLLAFVADLTAVVHLGVTGDDEQPDGGDGGPD